MKNKRRQDFIKPLRLLSVVSIISFIICLVIGLFVATLMNVGYFFLILGFVIFIVLHMIRYRMLYTCRCRRCGHVEVFTTKRMLIVGVQDRCPKCNAKLKVDEIVE